MADMRRWEDNGFTEAQAAELCNFEATAVSVDASGKLTTEAGPIIIDGGNANG